MTQSATSPANDTLIWNFKVLGHHTLDGFGGMGEGMSMQRAKDGRRILWLAHESAPKNYTAVDVSDPKSPKIVARADLPESHMRSNSLETVGDVMAIAYQTQKPGLKPAGFELFDISVPETPKRIAFVDQSGPTSRGVHQLWFADGEYIHMSSGSPDSTSRCQRRCSAWHLTMSRWSYRPTRRPGSPGSTTPGCATSRPSRRRTSRSHHPRSSGRRWSCGPITRPSTRSS